MNSRVNDHGHSNAAVYCTCIYSQTANHSIHAALFLLGFSFFETGISLICILEVLVVQTLSSVGSSLLLLVCSSAEHNVESQSSLLLETSVMKIWHIDH